MDTKKTLLQVSLLFAFAAVLALAAKTSKCATDCTNAEKEKFEEFKKNFSRSYPTKVAECEALNNFCVAYRAMVKHNADISQSYKMSFSGQEDKSPKQKAAAMAQRKGLTVDESAKNTPKDKAMKAGAQLKGSVDAAKARSTILKGTASEINFGAYTGPVENQGQCGSCWAFCTNAVLQFRARVQLNRTLALSEQDFVDCDRSFNKGCSGGSPLYALNYANASGVANQTAYPYTAKNMTCRRSTIKAAYISPRKGCRANLTETELKTLVDQVGVIAVIMGTTNSLMSYRSGIFYDRTCPMKPDHCVTLVGYGTDASGVNYWVLKNSWGTSWGMSGYFRLRRGVNACGIGLNYIYLPC